MRVVQILPELNEGGVERGVVELNREFTRRGIENFVISNGGKLAPEIENEGGVHVQLDVCSKSILSAPARILKLRKILSEIAPDIVHVRSRVPAWLVKFARPRAKIVSTVHGINSVNFYSKIMTDADAIICPSGYARDHVVRSYGADAAKITIIPRGIDLEKFNPKNLDERFIAEFRQNFNLAQDDFIVSAVGRITQIKDYKTLIRAAALASEQNLKILIVGGVGAGRDEYFSELKSLVAELGLDERVIFTDSQSKVAEIYSLSSVTVSASSKPESFGRSMAEAIALNCPVIATRHGGALDIIKEGENGYFFDVGDAQALAGLFAPARELKFDGYGYVSQNFSLEQMVEKTIKVYESLI
ncbi:glycosyltransferase family 4 protein [uncultured Campylobacter sp.]|uniref:glycosyltransferase family 4 protein n=1 Tax=uncultured Campylobacter sp. TaxID=218934 RepID=UPI00262A96AB|nr:glycosyltransferase family 4 protein [uncultured Campylobacter sp.]